MSQTAQPGSASNGMNGILPALKTARLPFYFPLLLALACPAGALPGDGPSLAPQLRIEAGAHTAGITSVGSSADGQTLISCSLDKTLRVWRVEEHEFVLEETLRPPIGSGSEGMLYACAISPDGKNLAAAGWTGLEWDESNCIYLIDRLTGTLRKRIVGLPNVINELNFSPDGERLLANFGGTWGVRCYSALGEELWDGGFYQGGSFGAAWLTDGKCVTSSFDGHLRLYDASGERLLKIETPGAQQPHGIAFDGLDEVLVGYSDSNRVDRFAATDLEYRGELAASSGEGSLPTVAHFAGGWWAAGIEAGASTGSLFSWASEDNALQTHKGPTSLITDLCSVNGERLLASDYGPGLRLFDAQANELVQLAPVKCDMRGKVLDFFQASPDGKRIWFGREPFGAAPVLLDMNAANLTEEGAAPDDLSPPRHEAPGMLMEGFDSGPDFRINGHPLLLQFNESVRTAVVTPNNQIAVLGTDFSLRAVGKGGEELWRQAVPESCWGLHLAAAGKLIIAAYGDGTLRWHRLHDGAELLAFFPHADGKRWVAWTPSGYYDCSLGGEDLIGWHVNRGADSLADFYPASRFRERFYRPAVIAAVLDTRDEAIALEELGLRAQDMRASELPPVVRILRPSHGERLECGPLTVSYTLSSADPVTDVQVLINGIECAKSRGLSVVGKGKQPETLQAEISIPREFAGQALSLAVIAGNKNGTSQAAVVRVGVAPFAPSESDDPLTKPTCYVLAVGVSDYVLDDLDLGLAAKDARDMAEAFRSQAGKLFRNVEVRLIENATGSEVIEGLEWLEGQCTARDLAVLFLAGHGVTDSRDRYFFLPSDANLEKLRSTAVVYTDITQTIEALPGKTLAFIDTCHAGNVTGGARRRSALGAASMTRVINELASAENGGVVFAAATGNQFGLEKEEWGNGAFTKAIVEALSGKAPADMDDAVLRAVLSRPTLTVNLLNTYVAERVKGLTSGRQTPTMERPATIPDFPIAVR